MSRARDIQRDIATLLYRPETRRGPFVIKDADLTANLTLCTSTACPVRSKCYLNKACPTSPKPVAMQSWMLPDGHENGPCSEYIDAERVSARGE